MTYVVQFFAVMDDDWITRDEIIKQVAGREFDFAGSDFETRDGGWCVDTLEEAEKLKKRIEDIPNITKIVIERQLDCSWGYCAKCRAMELKLFGDDMAQNLEHHEHAVKEAGCKHPTY